MNIQIFGTKKSADTRKAERRLFYVAMTRAKNSLHLFYMRSGSAFYRELFGQPENEKMSSKKSRKQASFPTATVYSSKASRQNDRRGSCKAGRRCCSGGDGQTAQ